MAGSNHFRPGQIHSAHRAPLVTDNFGTSTLESAETQVDADSFSGLHITQESEHGREFAGYRRPDYSPITPSSQPSPTGAKAKRTPLPNAPPASSNSSTSTSGDANSRLDWLAEAAATRTPSPERPRVGRPQGRGKGMLRKYVEQALTQHGQPMTSFNIHKAVVALAGKEYKYQTVRKALCNKTAPFEPLKDSRWALKCWGLSASRRQRRFGTGGGTMEARCNWRVHNL
ncbi:hypothetical protein V496_03240 [Pseudogymnoascus sp. VKM F-4515 (FW-2607)]|nr:hypothetical protein V496_03240 [Pseudogymnoascus sp. VKM F-4515 (FW-2607)]KFY76191.1 hypothetical protein V498_09745 [Pseudogymnoascus sp. VKM F-4517 (FW-2822)]